MRIVRFTPVAKLTKAFAIDSSPWRMLLDVLDLGSSGHASFGCPT